MKERVTVDFDSESYYLDGKYWASWDHFGEEMAEQINILLDKEEQKLNDYKDRVKQALIDYSRVEYIAEELDIDLGD